MADLSSLRRRARAVFRRLGLLYPDAHCALNHADPYQLLVATILSAQCTDARVNLVTPALFARYPDAASMARAKQADLEKLIRSTGFFRAKAKNLCKCCQVIVEKHGGEVPGILEELVALPGVGRKTANVVLGDGFGVPGITVDTHVGRLSRRLGFTTQTDPVKVERDLMQVWSKKDWTLYNHRMIFHGRQVCFARRPACDECKLIKLCPRVGLSERET